MTKSLLNTVENFLKEKMKTRIHVNQHKIRSNMKKGTNDDFWAVTICIIDLMLASIVPMVDWFTLPLDTFPVIYYFIRNM